MAEEQIIRLFRARRTVLQMAKDRGYEVDESAFNMTKSQFLQRFGSDLKRQDLEMLLNRKNNASDKIYVFFLEPPKPGTAVFKKLVERMRVENIFQAIAVVQQDLHPIARRAVAEVQRTAIHIDVFQEAELFSNITENQNVPKHEVLGDEEKKRLLETYGIKESQLPRILVHDPVARYYGLKKGHVVKIKRKSESAEAYYTYRFCV